MRIGDISQVQHVDSKQLFHDQTQALPSIGIEVSYELDILWRFVGFVLEQNKIIGHSFCTMYAICMLMIENEEKLPSLAFMSIFSLDAFLPGFLPRLPLSFRS